MPTAVEQFTNTLTDVASMEARLLGDGYQRSGAHSERELQPGEYLKQEYSDSDTSFVWMSPDIDF